MKNWGRSLRKRGLGLAILLATAFGLNCCTQQSSQLVPTPSPNPTGNPTPNPTPPPSTQDNILTNGDFSLGLECWNQWSWSSGSNFSLSTDYHSAPWSGELKCASSSSKPESEYVSPDIPVTPGKSYFLSLWSKCAPGAKAIIYIQATTAPRGGIIEDSLTCNGTWAQSKVTFTLVAGLSAFHFNILNYSQDLLIDDVVLTYSDGSVPVQTPSIHNGNRIVSVSENTVDVDGRPYLALGFVGTPQSAFTALRNMGGNTLLGAQSCFNVQGKGILDAAYEAGINVLPDSTKTAESHLDNNGMLGPSGSGGLASLPTIVSGIEAHLANIGWFLADEPDLAAPSVYWGYIAPSMFIEEAAAVRTKTPLPVVVDFQHAHYDVPSVDAPYNGSADIWMTEPYGAMTNVDHAANLLTGIQERPIWMFNSDSPVADIVPKAYNGIIDGVTGIFYFNWSSFSANPAAMAAASQVFSELNSLTNVIFSTPVTVTPPTGIIATGRSYNGKTYIFAVNQNATTVAGSFSAPGLPSGTPVAVQFESRSITAGSGSFTDTFTGVSRHVYVY